MFQATPQPNKNNDSSYAYGMALRSGSVFLAWLDGQTVRSRMLSDDKSDQLGTKGSRGPAMANFNGTPYIAYRDGSGGSSGAPIVYASNPPAWSQSQVPVTDGEPKTDQPVSLSPFGSQLYMAYKQGQHPVGIAWFDGTKWHGYTNSQHAIVNNANPKVAANKNSHGDDWVVTSRGPSIASLTSGGTERLYLAFKENGGKGHVYFGSSSDPSNASSWSNLKRVGDDYLTNGTPALAAWKGKIVMVFPNAEDKNRLYSATFDPAQNSWSQLAALLDGGSHLDPGNDKETAKTNVTLVGDDANNRLFLSFGKDGHPQVYYLTPA